MLTMLFFFRMVGFGLRLGYSSSHVRSWVTSSITAKIIRKISLFWATFAEFREALQALHMQYRSTDQIFSGCYPHQISKLNTAQPSINRVPGGFQPSGERFSFTAPWNRLPSPCSDFSFSFRFFSNLFTDIFFNAQIFELFNSRGGDGILQECWEEEQVGRLKGRAGGGDFSGGEKGCGLDSCRNGSRKTKIGNTEPNTWWLDET